MQVPHGAGRNCLSIGVANGVCQDTDTVPAGTVIGGQPVTAYSQYPTAAAYRGGGTAGITCPAVGGCTNSQAFPVPTELAILLNSRNNADGQWALNEIFDWLPPRSTNNDVTVYQIVTGFDGKLPIKDWTWELYASHGQSTTNTQINGAMSLDRYRTIVTSPNYGRGFTGTQNAFNGELINGIHAGRRLRWRTCHLHLGSADHGELRSLAGLHRCADAAVAEPATARADHLRSEPGGRHRSTAGPARSVARSVFRIARTTSNTRPMA